MKDDYFRFLVEVVLNDQDERYDFRLSLLHRLYRMEYIPLIPNDDNRRVDGLELREDFINHGGGQHALPFGPCSVLEMLIGLSFRLEFETSQSRWEKSIDEWFWILISNLDLDYYNNKDLSKKEYYNKIDDVVTLFVGRGYKSNGEGGLFPLKNPRKDQKKVEIWYQMSAYILENYPI